MSEERDQFKEYRLARGYCESRDIEEDSELYHQIIGAFVSGYGFGKEAKNANDISRVY